MKTKLLAVCVSLFLLSGCTIEHKNVDVRPKNICIDGVTYIVYKESQYNRGFGFMSVKLNRESKIVECN